MMLIAAKSATPWFEGTHTYYGMAFALAVLLIWNKYVWPYFRPRVRSWRNNRLLMRGRPAVDDVSPEVVPLARRLRRIEKRQDETNDITKRLDDGQVAIVERMDRHDEKVTAIDGKVDAVGAKVDEMSNKIDKLFENGGDTNNPGDMLARMAKATPGAYLASPDEQETPPST